MISNKDKQNIWGVIAKSMSGTGIVQRQPAELHRKIDC